MMPFLGLTVLTSVYIIDNEWIMVWNDDPDILELSHFIHQVRIKYDSYFQFHTFTAERYSLRHALT